MLCLKQLSLILIVGTLATFAEFEKTLKDTPSAPNEQDLRFLFKPLIQVEASKPNPRPTTVVVKPYPIYPYYPAYPYPTAQPTRPPTAAPVPPTVPPTPPTLNYPFPYPPTNGFFPFYPPQPPTGQDQQPFIIVIRPQGSNANNGNNGNNNPNNGRDNSNVIYVRDPLQEVSENQPEDFDLDNVAEAVKVNGGFAIDTKDIKLPFGLQLVSQVDDGPSDSNKKVRNQETLIYLKNYKKGRQLAAAQAA